ncbi:MAG: exodeoxyribonuclease V subunit beta [Xylophilus ampelinus]
MAMIDEFQDTDPLQYRIFDAVYRVAANDPAHGLVLIGDPKQAIYAFRGADIHTYLHARRDTAGRHYTLATNFRSTHGMVAAVNRVFAQAERDASGEGAFLLRHAGGDPVPFYEVQARGRAERLRIDGHDAPALTCWVLDEGETLSKTAYVQRLARACAAEIDGLLARGRAGRAGFEAPGAAARGLHPGDVAVLVNNGREAAAVRKALAARGVRSVYLSDKESVFRSPQAQELQRWLAACAEPEDDRLLRAALATPSLGLDWPALDRLRRDELAWEARVMQFRGYRQSWRRQGVLPMLRRLLADFAVPRRLLARGGERALTDLLHLAELLQQASALLDGEHSLVRHLAEQQQDAADAADARKLRLEDDAALVKVVTVHKSKGLEYPLVFLPFACAFRATGPEDLPLTWHDEEGRLQMALGPDPQALARADRERLGEDLRKLYVALTRARHATWIGMAPLKGLEASAPGYLLAGGRPVAAGDLAAGLWALRGAVEHIAVVPLPEPSADAHGAQQAPAGDCRLPSAAEPPGPERVLRRSRPEPWRIASYSSLQVDTAGGPDDAPAQEPAADTAAEAIYAESLDAAAPAAPASPGEGLHGFPRGAHPGSFLHELLEWAAGQGFAQVASEPAAARDLIARRCRLRGWDRWIPALSSWLPDFLRTPFPLGDAGPVRLDGVGACQVEMEFWFSAARVDLARLDALVRRATLGGAPRPALLPGRLDGMLKGFVDLVFEHEGRFFVADYKSNWLGPDDQAYGPEAMRGAVLAHRYELQYVIYLFALHRLLRSRLPDYDYDRHVGGALCLFLRGSAASTRGVHLERPPRALIEALDGLFAGGGDGEGRP